MIVIDVGCAPHGHEVSIERLIERFAPDVLYGFDPWPDLQTGVTHVETPRIGAKEPRRTEVTLSRKAAWTHDGELEYAWVDGERSWDSTVARDKNSRGEWAGHVIAVPCFDLAAFIRELPERPIVKLDIEGAEYVLLDHLVDTDADLEIELLLMEWHDEKMVGSDYAAEHQRLLGRLRCPVKDWIL